MGNSKLEITGNFTNKSKQSSTQKEKRPKIETKLERGWVTFFGYNTEKTGEFHNELPLYKILPDSRIPKEYHNQIIADNSYTFSIPRKGISELMKSGQLKELPDCIKTSKKSTKKTKPKSTKKEGRPKNRAESIQSCNNCDGNPPLKDLDLPGFEGKKCGICYEVVKFNKV